MRIYPFPAVALWRSDPGAGRSPFLLCPGTEVKGCRVRLCLFCPKRFCVRDITGTRERTWDARGLVAVEVALSPGSSARLLLTHKD